MIIFNTDVESIWRLAASLTDLILVLLVVLTNLILRKRIAKLEQDLSELKSKKD